MKKFSLIVMALALVMGLSQCQKRPNAPVFGGGYDDATKEITFTTGNGSKAAIEDALTMLNYKWESGDKLYVYASTSGTFDENSRYCGTLLLSPESVGQCDGSFSGQLKNLPVSEGTLRFFYFGGEVTEDEDAATAEINLNQQDGTVAEGGLKQKIIACKDVSYEAGKRAFSAILEVQFAIVKMDLHAFGNCNVTMKGDVFNKISVDRYGRIESALDGTTTLNGVTSESTSYFVAIGTNNKETPSTITAKFEGNNLRGEKAMPIMDNGYYYYTDEGLGVPVEVESVFKDMFSIDKNGTKVIFSKGNLQFRASDKTWRFAENQYDVIGSGNKNISATYNGWIDLFGWATGYVSTEGGNKSYPWQTSENNADYYNSGNLNSGCPSKDNLYDWGHNIGDGSTWFTLTRDQWVWLMGKKGSGKIPGENCRLSSTVSGKENARFAKIKVNDVEGLLLFPDVFEWNVDKMGGEIDGTYINNYKGKEEEGKVKFYGNYTKDQFAEMEKAGAIFLPVTGYRDGKTYYEDGFRSYYWSSTMYGNKYAYDLKFDYVQSNISVGVDPQYENSGKYHGMGVRLVKLAE
ncbi:MAG: hypothetical protein Q4F69_11790 [Bacteroidia bacterium]|nr:hypothetical protein [Bacteroidia bacterium]